LYCVESGIQHHKPSNNRNMHHGTWMFQYS